MELLTYILYIIASKTFILLMLSIFLTIGGFSFVAFWWAKANSSKPSPGEPWTIKRIIVRTLIPAGLVAVTVTVLGIGILSIVNLIRPHLIDGMMMNSIGERTTGKVVGVEQTSNLHNNNRVMRHHVIYKDLNGNNIETYFETWDFNVYPSANSVRYPQKGESFGVLYLRSYPTAFLIMTDDDSEYSRGKECGRLLGELEQARIKFEFDPQDKGFKKAVEDSSLKVINAKCGTITFEPAN